jgi:hypothetical protein
VRTERTPAHDVVHTLAHAVALGFRLGAPSLALAGFRVHHLPEAYFREEPLSEVSWVNRVNAHLTVGARLLVIKCYLVGAWPPLLGHNLRVGKEAP